MLSLGRTVLRRAGSGIWLKVLGSLSGSRLGSLWVNGKRKNKWFQLKQHRPLYSQEKPSAGEASHLIKWKSAIHINKWRGSCDWLTADTISRTECLFCFSLEERAHVHCSEQSRSFPLQSSWTCVPRTVCVHPSTQFIMYPGTFLWKNTTHTPFTHKSWGGHGILNTSSTHVWPFHTTLWYWVLADHTRPGGAGLLPYMFLSPRLIQLGSQLTCGYSVVCHDAGLTQDLKARIDSPMMRCKSCKWSVKTNINLFWCKRDIIDAPLPPSNLSLHSVNCQLV